MAQCILVTGGAGFIGSNFVLRSLARTESRIINLDRLTYAANLQNLSSASGNPRYQFIHGDICDAGLVSDLLAKFQPTSIVHFAAESHVDRSILGPQEFIRTNVTGTFTLLECVKTYWESLGPQLREAFRFLHVSTDEVYGSLGPDDPPFSESSPYAPNSPYAASKAAADHLVRSYNRTYGLPTLTTNCSNNYGPYQFPEKLIPLVICNARDGEPIPVYGDGSNVRDWLHVDDHCDAVLKVLASGRTGGSYNIGGGTEINNLDLVRMICALMDELGRNQLPGPHSALITFVKDRPGHDRRYAIDSSKIRAELGWKPAKDFQHGLRETILWYLENGEWVNGVRNGSYKDWISLQYAATS